MKKTLPLDGKQWLKDDSRRKEFLDGYLDIQERLDKGNGFLRVENFLPAEVCEEVFEALKKLQDWEDALGEDDEKEGYGDSISHRFSLAELDCVREKNEKIPVGETEEDYAGGNDILLQLGSLLWDLFPSRLPNFTAACYGHNDYIDPHDDYVLEEYSRLETREIAQGYGKRPPRMIARSETITFEREVAMVLYLNKNWKKDFGGEFLDMETQKTFLPLFNSIVFFQVPRMHAVRPVKKNNAKRYSIFGWWLKELLVKEGEDSDSDSDKDMEIDGDAEDKE